MDYDCSITKRQGCNYCMKYKPIEKLDAKMVIGDTTKDLGVLKNDMTFGAYFKINYCPICGRKL